MSAPERDSAASPWFPPPSTFRWSWSIPAEILEPLLHRRDDEPVRSADGPDAELPAG